MNEFSEKEKRLEACIRENNTKEAVRILVELATISAGRKDFPQAERYRDRLYAVDPMALSEIIRVNDIIENEKTLGIDPNHRQLFAGLYDILTVEQGNLLFYAFEEMTIQADMFVFRQGDKPSGLFFLNQGRLRVGYRQGERTLLVKMLEPGDTFGEETFFANSLCTSTVTAYSTAKVSRLDRQALARLNEQAPGIETKLRDFCYKKGAISDAVRQRGIDRRDQVRKKLHGKAAIQFLSSSGALIGKPLRVGLSDVSTGGIAFLLRMSDEEKAGLILGRELVIQLSSDKTSPPLKVQKKATIVAVSPSPFDDYSFHAKFEKELTLLNMQTIASVFSRGS